MSIFSFKKVVFPIWGIYSEMNEIGSGQAMPEKNVQTIMGASPDLKTSKFWKKIPEKVYIFSGKRSTHTNVIKRQCQSVLLHFSVGGSLTLQVADFLAP